MRIHRWGTHAQRVSEDKRNPQPNAIHAQKKFSSSQFCARAEWPVRPVIKVPAGNWGACGERIGYKLLSGEPLSLPCVRLCNPDDIFFLLFKTKYKTVNLLFFCLMRMSQISIRQHFQQNCAQMRKYRNAHTTSGKKKTPKQNKELHLTLNLKLHLVMFHKITPTLLIIFTAIV